MGKIYFMRHCRPHSPYPDGGYFNGSRTDDPLSPEGIAHARECALQLKEKHWPLEAIVSSDLKRAFETAHPAAELLGLPLFTDPRLREVDLGLWDGKPDAEVEAGWPGEPAKRRVDLLHYRPPEGENYGDVFARLKDAADDYGARFPGAVLFVCHGGTIRIWLAAHGLVPFERFYKPPIPYGALIDPNDFDPG